MHQYLNYTCVHMHTTDNNALSVMSPKFPQARPYISDRRIKVTSIKVSSNSKKKTMEYETGHGTSISEVHRQSIYSADPTGQQAQKLTRKC